MNMTKKNYIQPRLDIAVITPHAALMGTSAVQQVNQQNGEDIQL